MGIDCMGIGKTFDKIYLFLQIINICIDRILSFNFLFL